MKIELDLTNKTIKIAEGCNLDKLMENLEMLLPNGKWKEFKLLTNVQINWQRNPIVIQPYVNPLNPFPWYNPYYYGTTCNSNTQLLTETKYHTGKLDSNPGAFSTSNVKTTGIYCIEIK